MRSNREEVETKRERDRRIIGRERWTLLTLLRRESKSEETSLVVV